MTEQEKQKVKNLWLGGLSLRRISQLLPIKPKVFWKGVAEMKSNGDFPTERESTRQKVAKAFESTHNVYEIAETYGLTVNYVRKLKVEMGIKSHRPEHNYKQMAKGEKAKKIAHEIALGEKSLSQIARDFGVSRQRVHEIKKSMEII